MARWQLLEAHYIFAQQSGEKTEWEYRETDRITGRERRKRFEVPLYCPVNSIVCRPGSERPDDNGTAGPITYEGPPTPAMLALDDEAKAESAKHSKEWVHPIDSLEGNFSSKDLLSSLQKQFEAAASRTPAPAIVAEGVSKAEFEELKVQMAALMARNAELEAKPKAAARRV